MKEIGPEIREIRKHQGITLKVFSKRVGVTASLISQEECGLVLEGRLQIQIGSFIYTPEKDDSLCFSCEIPHRVRNLDQVPAVSVWCVMPPSFSEQSEEGVKGG